MKKMVALVLSLAMLLSAFSFSASAAYVTDGEGVFLAGDVNGDANINICDLVKANNGGGVSVAADLDGNGTVEAYDFALIRAIILRIDNSLWTE